MKMLYLLGILLTLIVSVWQKIYSQNADLVDLSISGNDILRTPSFDLSLARFVQKHKNSSVLFSKRTKTKNFIIGDSSLYPSQKELDSMRQGKVIERYQLSGRLDSAVSRYFGGIQYYNSTLRYSRPAADPIYSLIKERYSNARNYWSDVISNSVRGVSMVRMWNISVVASLIFGMFLMTMIYHYLGQAAAADSDKTFVNTNSQEQVAGAETSKEDEETALAEQILAEHKQQLEDEALSKNSFEGKIKEMVKGYPIEKMAPEIARQDKVVAAFMIGIAKKESDWGKHAPVLDGKDCDNYWGFRAQRERMGSGGHTCFDSTSDAVESVARRIKSIIEKEEIKTPAGMVTVWKCGYDCSWDSKAAVKKWVSDVDGYFGEVDSFEKK